MTGDHAFGSLDDLADVVHSFAADGHPIVVPDPGTEHGRRLLHTLGARIDTTMRGVGPVTAEAAHEATTTYDCRAYGCTNRAKNRRGPSAYLCDEHIELAKRNGRDSFQVERPATTWSGQKTPAGSLEKAARELVGLGRKADRAEQRAQKVVAEARAVRGEYLKARREFTELAKRLAEPPADTE